MNAVHYKNGKEQERLTGSWDASASTLTWEGERLEGGKYKIKIEIPSKSLTRTDVWLYKPDGELEFRWQGSSKPAEG